MVQIVPGKTALDEKYGAIGVPGCPRGSADGIRRFADEQRFIAGDEVDGGEAAGQRGRQLLGVQTQVG
jgi:hypothetical protein